MTVVVLTDCPPKLRGDLSKWLLEINTGVYVGNTSARVRDELWDRICEHVKHGRATMVFRAANEQKMDFRVHNALWEPVDYDGLKLIRRPSPERIRQGQTPKAEATGFSKAAVRQKLSNMARAKQRVQTTFYTVIDIETTGLDPLKDSIIELAALRIEDRKPVAEFHTMVNPGVPLPPAISRLTGITDGELVASGVPLTQAMTELIAFIGNDLLISHHASFDQRFLMSACKACELPFLRNAFMDTLAIARRKVSGVDDYKLATLAKHFSLDVSGHHRALKDCYLAYGIYDQLNQISDYSD